MGGSDPSVTGSCRGHLLTSLFTTQGREPMDGLIAGLVNAHSIWRYVVLISGGITIGRLLMGWMRRDAWRPIEERLGRLFVTAVDVAVGLGVLVWLFQGRWDGVDVLRSWRHPGLMLVATVIVHYGWQRVQAAPVGPLRYGRALLYFVLAGVVILVGLMQIQGAF